MGLYKCEETDKPCIYMHSAILTSDWLRKYPGLSLVRSYNFDQ